MQPRGGEAARQPEAPGGGAASPAGWGEPAVRGHEFTDTFVGGAGPTPTRRPRRRLLASLLALIVVVGAAGIAIVVTGGKSAEAAVIDSVNTTMADGTAHITMALSAHTPTGTVTGTGTGAIDFNNNAMQLQLSVGEAAQQLQLQIVYLAGSIYENIPGIDQLVPGKSWVSLDLSSLQGAGSQNPSSLGTGNNPAAELRLLAQQGNTVVALGSSTIDGISVEGYAVTLDASAIKAKLAQAKLPSWMTSALSNVKLGDTTLKVFVDGSGLLRRMSIGLNESVGSSGNVGVDESLDFSDYGTAVSVSAPPPDQVVSFQQFLQAAEAQAGGTTPS